MAEFILSAFADEAAVDLKEQLRICNNNLIKHIEMRGVNGKPIVNHTVPEAKEIKKILDDNGFSVSAVGSPFGKINIKDSFLEHLEHFKRGIEIAHILDTKYIRIFSFYMGKDEKPEYYQNEVLERLDAFLENANGIICAHENERDIFGDTPERCKVLYDTFGGKLKLVFDAANFIQCGIDPLQAYSLLEPYIEYMHIKDASMSDGSITPAGDGDGNIETILNRFAAKPGERFLSIEPHLKVFEGYKALENQSNGSTETTLGKNYIYTSNEEAFGAASAALRALLCANGFKLSKDIERGYGIWSK